MSGYLTTVGRYLAIGLRPPAFPDDWEDKQQVTRYRVLHNEWCHAASIAVIGSLIVGTLLSATLFGWWPDRFNFNRVAWSEDLVVLDQQIDLKRAAARKTFEERLAKVENLLADMVRAQRIESASTLTGQIFSAKKEQCQAIGASRNARVWTERLRALEVQYRDLLGEKFDTPSCGEV